MSLAHIQQLKKELERSHWVIHSGNPPDEYSDVWEIKRPNGDTPLKISFTIGGNGKYGAALGDETLSDAIGCNVVEYPEIDVYFGKYSGQFQKDIARFISCLNEK